jgi:hypothetical protein
MLSTSVSRFPVFHRTGGFFMNMKKLVLVLLIGGVLQAAVAQNAAFPEAESEDSLDFVRYRRQDAGGNGKGFRSGDGYHRRGHRRVRGYIGG